MKPQLFFFLVQRQNHRFSLDLFSIIFNVCGRVFNHKIEFRTQSRQKKTMTNKNSRDVPCIFITFRKWSYCIFLPECDVLLESRSCYAHLLAIWYCCRWQAQIVKSSCRVCTFWFFYIFWPLFSFSQSFSKSRLSVHVVQLALFGPDEHNSLAMHSVLLGGTCRSAM